MTKASDNAYPSVLITEGTVPSTPAAGKQRVYIDSTTKRVKLVNSSGVNSDLPGAELDYVEFTSDVNITATTEATANTIVTGNAVTYNGTDKIYVEFFGPDCAPDTGAAGRFLQIWLYDNGSSIGYLTLVMTPAASAMRVPVTVGRRITPSAAAHTYSIRGSVSAGTGHTYGGAGGTGNQPQGYIRITKV